MDHRRNGRGTGATAVFRLQVYRIGGGGSAFIRTLSESYDGCLTHWNGGESSWHDPVDCAACRKGSPPTWKGYFAGEYWSLERSVWVPAVVELTESSELDVRELFTRGQVWHFQRPPDRRGHKGKIKRYPASASLSEIIDPSLMRPAFEVLPILRCLYHCPEMELGVKNPMPARMFLDAAQGEQPAALRGKAPPPPMSDADALAFLEARLKAGMLSQAEFDARAAKIKQRIAGQGNQPPGDPSKG